METTIKQSKNAESTLVLQKLIDFFNTYEFSDSVENAERIFELASFYWNDDKSDEECSSLFFQFRLIKLLRKIQYESNNDLSKGSPACQELIDFILTNEIPNVISDLKNVFGLALISNSKVDNFEKTSLCMQWNLIRLFEEIQQERTKV